jgi:hypothetical protein
VTWRLRATQGIILSGRAIAVVMGLLGGLIPAERAARPPIITALRET